MNKYVPENLKCYSDSLLKSINIVKSKTNRMLISAFSGGDMSKLIDYPDNLLFAYNPNPYHFNRQPSVKLEDSSKLRVFNFAGLVQDKTKVWLKSQGVKDSTWKMLKYGSRKDGQDRVTEDVMVNIYSNHWGILMPGYYHAGSGWWRARPLQVADSGSILIGEPSEMMLYYNDRDVAEIKALDIVELSDIALADLAKLQRDLLYKNHPLNKLIQQEELNLCLTY